MKNSRKSAVVYWASTVLFCIAMTFSAFMYVTNDHMKNAFSHLGFPSYFRIELAVAKLLGVVVLLTRPHFRLTEWAYAGFGITLISAVVAHLSSGDGPSDVVPPIVLGTVFLLSYITYHRRISV